VKRRFVENYPFQKMFEVYEITDKESHKEGSQKLHETLRTNSRQLRPRSGPRLWSWNARQQAVKVLTDKSRFLAVNTQVNAHNRGFNTISKYPHADYICVSENEIRLDRRSRQKDLKELTWQVAEQLTASSVTITRGSQGSLCYDGGNGFIEVPAFTSHIVDRVGAGDAVFAVTSLCMVQKAPIEIIGFTANIVGSHAVSMVANQRPVDHVSLMKHIETVLK